MEKKKGFFVDLNTNTSKKKKKKKRTKERKKKKVLGGGCRIAMKAQAAIKTLATIRRGYLSQWLWFCRVSPLSGAIDLASLLSIDFSLIKLSLIIFKSHMYLICSNFASFLTPN